MNIKIFSLFIFFVSISAYCNDTFSSKQVKIAMEEALLNADERNDLNEVMAIIRQGKEKVLQDAYMLATEQKNPNASKIALYKEIYATGKKWNGLDFAIVLGSLPTAIGLSFAIYYIGEGIGKWFTGRY
jgi:hypothetical protein